MALDEGVVLKLGQRVQFVHPLARTTGLTSYSRREWTPNKWDTATHEGIVIGKRTLANGEVYGSEDGWELNFDERFTAYLVVETMHSNPRRVLPEHITLLPPEPPTPATPEGALL